VMAEADDQHVDAAVLPRPALSGIVTRADGEKDWARHRDAAPAVVPVTLNVENRLRRRCSASLCSRR